MDGKSINITEDKLRQLQAILPEAFSEGRIDWEKLQLALGADINLENERYVLNWAGKSDAFRNLQTPTTATLAPAPEESVNFDSSENIFIEGENLEVLKILQKSYYGKIKMIYIDPPYNTGNDSFVYPDDFSESREAYLQRIQAKDEDGYLLKDGQFRQNSRDSGRYHSNWLSMMYPRLYLAKNLLVDDGLIFVSIDNNEVHNLRMVLDEIFGEENFIHEIAWKKTYGGGSKTNYVVDQHEYILCYSKNKSFIEAIELPPNPETRKYYTGSDEKIETRGPFRTQPLATTSMDDRPNLRFPIPFEGEDIWPEKQWQWSKDRVLKALKNNELLISKQPNGNWSVRYKQYLFDENGEERGAKLFSLLEGPYTQVGTAEIKELFGDGKVFTFPKPSSLIRHLLSYTWQEENVIILDFFAGSCSTAQAVIDFNVELSKNHSFILIQIPEVLEKESPAYQLGFNTVADVGKERIKRVIKKVSQENPLFAEQGQDLGFKVFKLKPSNFKLWRGDGIGSGEALEQQLGLLEQPVHEQASEANLLYELLLKSGYPLTAAVERIQVGEGHYFLVESSLALVLSDLDDALLADVLARRPQQLICLDSLFANNDARKTNTQLQCKDAGVTFQSI
ncbi:MAG: site-specific DNA-methyltransferase [Anaerolineae bacterium]|nr:site-specific DNA-methyltransferase [Anaerolineae bacterium]